MKKALSTLLLILFSLSISAQSPCLANDTLKIVVIGSSTAAGAGASPSDSAWVNRYRHYLQSVNPANSLINLAQGGYNTWRLMPDYFVPPGSRPQPDTLRNISHALRQNPDAIIINLPSNDAAIGTGLNEQMSNFIHMDSLAATQGVPVWVCTTQPRNFNASYIQVQLDVRDSINRYFGNRAIDFWSGLANAQNTIDSLYNSGDGVHVNNRGHRLLFNRVRQKQIADSLVSALPGIDLWPKSIEWLNPSRCGSPQSIFRVQIANLRMDSLSSPAQVHLVREDLSTGIIDTLSQALSSIKACDYHYLNFSLNTSTAQAWRLWAITSSNLDPNSANNISPSIIVRSASLPSLNSSDSTFCAGDSLNLQASTTDSLFWFADSSLQNLINAGPNYNYGLGQDDTLYLQARRGPFVYLDQVSAAQSSNITWNGAMFNLIAGTQSLILDSIRFYAGSTADLQVNLRTKNGSYQGFENTATAWSAPLSDSVYNAQTDSAYFLDFGSISLNPGDTLACYLYLENANHRLRYQSSSAMFTYQGAALAVEAGSGIAHTFGSIYHPRHINADFYYHYGQNPLGQCQSAIQSLILKESEISLDLGGDTLHDNSLDLVLKLPSGFRNAYWWISPQSGDSLVIPAFSYNDSDSLWIVLSAEDSLGCSHTDSLLVSFRQTFKLDETETQLVNIYPNPAKNMLWVEQKQTRFKDLLIYSSQGQLVVRAELGSGPSLINLKLKPGVYFLYLDHSYSRKLIIN